jgi:hypothetical protein
MARLLNYFIVQRYKKIIGHYAKIKMRNYLLAALILFSALLFNACSKSSASTITGKWKVINDSTIITGPTVSYDIYNGSIDDYFVFTPRNILYIKEASLYDTINYKLVSNDTILLPGIGFSINGITEPSTISFMGNRMRIVANAPGNIITPGHQYQRIISLER